MSPLALLRALRFLVVEDCFDRQTCEHLRGAMTASPSESALIGVEGALDERQRRTRAVVVSPEHRLEAARRILAVRDRAVSHFGVELTAMEGPQFLRYRAGDFFIRHMDRDRDGGNRRQVSFIAFLNADFEGGALTFFGTAAGRPLRLTVPPAEGLLLLFRADWIHEVAPVTRGERLTMVGWFS